MEGEGGRVMTGRRVSGGGGGKSDDWEESEWRGRGEE